MPNAKEKKSARTSKGRVVVDTNHDFVPDDDDYLDAIEIKQRAIEDANSSFDRYVGQLK